VTGQSPELKDAYERLDEIIREVVRLEEWDGLVTDWVVVAANQYFADDGRSMTSVGQLLPGGGDSVPVYRVMGLLDFAHSAYQTSVTTPDDGGDERD